MILCVVTGASGAGDGAGTWQQWEHVFTSSTDRANPCVDIQIHVHFSGPDGQTMERLAFWDGGRRFVVRCAFPKPGTWRWETLCSDASDTGLQGQSGEVRVLPSKGQNPLLKHGYLKVSADGRLLIHADETPFLWIGDTCWAAPVNATPEEWDGYVADRTQKGYTLLQLSIAWAPEPGRGAIPPFLSTLPDITMPNPAYFQNLDRIVTRANEAGLAVMMVGFMETPHRYPQPEQIAVFSRYVAARYAGSAVVFSPSFDSGILEQETLAAAMAIREAAPDNLITMHMGTGVGPHFHDAKWLDFDMYQSGHNGGDRAVQSTRVAKMSAELLALTPRKPIVNGEAIYEESYGAVDQDVRRTAWLTFLSGGVGYTAGIDDVYEWTPEVMVKMLLPSSDQIALLTRFLRAIPWTELTPAPERVLNQPEDATGLMACALTGDKTMTLAYLPQGGAITLDLEGCPPEYGLAWLNPVSGELQVAGNTFSTSHTRLQAPDTGDWVAVLSVPGSPHMRSIQKALSQASKH
jgi:hypothetical protein